MVERYCATHQDKAITMGCLTCFQVLCPTCVDCTKECAYGSAHSPVTLKKLVKWLKDKRDEIKVKAWAKEGELATLLKRSTKVLTEYENKTMELADQLHKSRDKQLPELRRKYDELERELVDNRRTSKEQLVEFIERDIRARMTEMNTLLCLQDAKFKESHQVDLIKSFTETYNAIRRFIDEDLPSLTLTNQKSLCAQDTTEKLELKIVDGAAISIFPLSPPTSLKLKKKVLVSSAYCTVAHSNEFTYAAGDGPTLHIIDESANSVNLLTLPKISCIDGLFLYNGRLYIVAYPYKVLVADLNGNLITSWSLPESASDYVNKLVVTGDKVIVPDSSNKCFTVYSLDGRVFRHISCPQKGKWSKMALCAPDDKSVVVSSNTTSTVFRVNIATGETMWTCTAVDNPGGVACYKGEYILVTPLNSKRTEIHILQADTGRYLGKLTDPKPRTSSQVTDLCVSGDNLIIPRQTEKTVLHYELK
ncbi:uncharacterized protein [Watersipora subatra]|uniref:uncharacterized protein n=1 Tax=Watersipora subatra TaxID=2589382 RepID=UPI00355C4065